MLLLPACGTETPQPTDETSRATETASFVSLHPGATLPSLRFRLRAPPDHPLYLENCNGAFSWGLESSTGRDSTPVWTAATDACHSAPIFIAPGQQRDFTAELRLQPGEQLRSGSYRIAVYGLYMAHDEDHTAGAEVPHEQRISEPLEFLGS